MLIYMYKKLPVSIPRMGEAIWVIAVMGAVYISDKGVAKFIRSWDGVIFAVIVAAVLALRFVPRNKYQEGLLHDQGGDVFRKEVLESDIPVLIGFSSDYSKVCASISLIPTYTVYNKGIAHVPASERPWDYHKLARKYAGKIRFARAEYNLYEFRFLLNGDGTFSFSLPGEKEVYDDTQSGQGTSIGGKGKVKVEVAEAGGLRITEKAEAPMSLIKYEVGKKVWYGLSAYPTFLLFKGGRVVDAIQGVPPKAAFEERIKKTFV